MQIFVDDAFQDAENRGPLGKAQPGKGTGGRSRKRNPLGSVSLNALNSGAALGGKHQGKGALLGGKQHKGGVRKPGLSHRSFGEKPSALARQQAKSAQRLTEAPRHAATAEQESQEEQASTSFSAEALRGAARGHGRRSSMGGS